ncbi:hypothetical protein BGZ46_001532 [Entomortierella lignicola]|nr:hypothetical protein BGZ46_001532 [Entomortierella lignicola]
MDAEFDRLLSTQWHFLHQDWPIVERTKFHRTEIKDVQEIQRVKDFVQHKLGVIPVFFFLTTIFGVRSYPGPYRNVEKGLLLLYMLLKGTSSSDMGAFLPKSSFHDVFKEFFGRETHALDYKLTSCLATMCSSIALRLLTSRGINPEGFKHITLHLDGHDSRAAYINADKTSMYSYKLKKSGFRTQVCCDMNNMVVFVSQPAECRDFNDGTMLSRMSIEKRIHKLDSVAMDGGYAQHLNGVVEASDQLKTSKFCCPIRKTRGIELSDQEKRFNEVLGGFRSKIEGYFGEMQTTFHKFSHAAVNRVSDISTLSLQYKLCYLLLNIKRMVALRNITIEQHHSFWTQDRFDYPDGLETSSAKVPAGAGYAVKINDARDLFRLQDAFLGTPGSTIPDTEDHTMGDDGATSTEGREMTYIILFSGKDIAEAILPGSRSVVLIRQALSMSIGDPNAPLIFTTIGHFPARGSQNSSTVPTHAQDT